MRFDPEKHHRRSLRLAGYDYSRAGAYYVTVCARDRQCLFGEVIAGEMKMNEFGQMVFEEWFKTGEMRPHIQLDAFVVMPNHIHGILVLDDGGTLQLDRSFDRPTPRRGTLHVPPLHVPPLPYAPVQPTPTGEQSEQPTPNMIPTIISDGGTWQRAPTVEQFGRPTPDSIPTIVRLFKSATTACINRARNQPRLPVWQRNYYEHIIRDEAEWASIREYIETNPARWSEDRENPNAEMN